MDAQQFVTQVVNQNIDLVLRGSSLPTAILQYISNPVHAQAIDVGTRVITSKYAGLQFNNAEAVDLVIATIEMMVIQEAKAQGYDVPAFAHRMQWFIPLLNSLNAPRQLPSQYAAGPNYGYPQVPPQYMPIPRPSEAISSTNNAYPAFRSQNLQPTQVSAAMNRDAHIAATTATPVTQMATVPVTDTRAYAIQTTQPNVTAPLSNAQAVQNADKRPAIKPPSLRIVDHRAETADLPCLTNAADEYQLANIDSLGDEVALPLLASYTTKRYINVTGGTEEIIIDSLSDILAAPNVEDVILIITKLGQRSVVAWTAQFLATYSMLALKYRYSIQSYTVMPVFAFQQDCYKHFEAVGAKEDIEAILLMHIKRAFSGIEINTISTSAAHTREKNTVLAISTVEPLLRLPWANTYMFNVNQLKMHNGTTPEDTFDLYQDAFNLLEPESLYLDIIDASSCRYRVWRCGRPTASPNKFLVELR